MVQAAWHANAENPPLVYDIDVSNGGWKDPRPNRGNIIRGNYSHLPAELEPFVVSPLYKQRPPAVGYWVAGQKVWATPNALPDHSGWQPELPTTQHGAPIGWVVGWVCVHGGAPGTWKAIVV